MIKRLRNEDYLEENGETLSRIINGVVVEFERQEKQRMDSMFPDQLHRCTIIVPGLRENKKKHFDKGRLTLTR